MQETFRFETEDFLDGVVVSKRNISTRFTLNESSLNVSAGGYDGLGPRFGTAPLPVHAFVQTVSNNYQARSERTSEAAATGTFPHLVNRRRALGIINFETLLNDSLVASSRVRTYLFVSQDSNNNLKVAHTGERDTTAIDPNYKFGGYPQITSSYPTVLGGNFTREIPGGTLSEGLAAQDDTFLDTGTFNANRLALSAFWRLGQVDDFLDVGKAVNYASIAFITVSGPTFELGQTLGTVARTKAPQGNSGTGNDTPGDICLSLTGNPNDYYYSLNLNEPRVGLSFVGMRDGYPDWWIYYEWTFDEATDFERKTSKSMEWNESHYSLSNTGTARLRSSPNTTSDINLIYIYDNGFRHRCSYKWIGIAAGNKPYICIWRDDFQSTSIRAYGTASGATGYADNKIEFIDCSNLSYFRPTRATQDNSGVGGNYLEDDVEVSTVWAKWPNYDSTTATTFLGTSGILLGGANSGILRANTNYEFTFSIFDKTTNYETNVGVGAKLRTGTDDFVALLFQKSYALGGFANASRAGELVRSLSERFSERGLTNINFIEYRFYYREVGTFEWLPTNRISAVELIYTTKRNHFLLCADPVAGLPGGQPGGFIDYSPLQRDEYIQVVSFQNRAFWLSPRSLNFSLRNDLLSYPIRNAVPCPRGEFRGMIAHTYPGEAEQSSRLVIFGSQETYAGRFVTGAEIQQRVRIGPDDAATFPVDGTNFIVDAWTSTTSFSGRSAVVAEGVLYFWGPQGIYKDEGVSLPRKISDNLEPWIDSIFDANNTDKIHAVYSAQTDEVIWFYQPEAVSGAEQASKALVLHTKTGMFYPWEFNDLVIDSAQNVDDVITDADHDGLSGSRIVVAVREPDGTISRSMFLDEITYACDMQERSMYMVQEVTHPSATTRRLIFATGPDSIASKTGTAIVQSYRKYTGDTNTPDGIYTITASGSNYIEVERIDGSNDFPAQTFASENHFPVWIASEHSFTVRLQSQFWAPGGLRNWFRWLHCHTTFQVELLNDQPSGSYTLSNKYFSLQGTDNSATTFTLTDNSRGNCQVLDSIPFTKDNATGQAIKYEWSYTHLGGRWSMQYIAFDCQNESLGNLKFWQPV